MYERNSRSAPSVALVGMPPGQYGRSQQAATAQHWESQAQVAQERPLRGPVRASQQTRQMPAMLPEPNPRMTAMRQVSFKIHTDHRTVVGAVNRVDTGVYEICIVTVNRGGAQNTPDPAVVPLRNNSGAESPERPSLRNVPIWRGQTFFERHLTYRWYPNLAMLSKGPGSPRRWDRGGDHKSQRVKTQTEQRS